MVIKQFYFLVVYPSWAYMQHYFYPWGLTSRGKRTNWHKSLRKATSKTPSVKSCLVNDNDEWVWEYGAYIRENKERKKEKENKMGTEKMKKKMA